MSTSKPRIQAYIETALHDQFEQERLIWELSQSQALERILLERYQGNIARESVSDRDNLTPLINSINELRLRVSRLEDELESKLPSELESVTSELPSELELVTGELPSELESVTSELPSELELVTGELPSELELVTGELPSELELVTGELPSELPSELQGITQLSLAKRLKCTDRYVRKMEKEGKLEQWSKQKDPDQIGWELRDKKYYPLIEAQESELPSMLELSNGLSADSLARRFGVTYPYILKLQGQGEIEGFSKEADPQGLEWEFRDGPYYPKILSLHQ